MGDADFCYLVTGLLSKCFSAWEVRGLGSTVSSSNFRNKHCSVLRTGKTYNTCRSEGVNFLPFQPSVSLSHPPFAQHMAFSASLSLKPAVLVQCPA